MSVPGQPFRFYIKNPDGSLTLHEGQPPAGYVETSQHQQPSVQYQQLPMATSMVAAGGCSYSQFPQAASMVATPMPTKYAAAPPATTTAASLPNLLTTAAPKKKHQDWGTGAAGQRLGGGHGGGSEAERRQMALQAAEQRQSASVGVSKERSAELARQRQREELLGRITEHYRRLQDDVPMALNVASVEQLRKHLDNLRNR